MEEGTYTVTVTVQHDALAAVTTPGQTIMMPISSSTNLVEQQPASRAGWRSTSTGADHGHRDLHRSGRRAEPRRGGDFAATVNWGDGDTDAGTVVGDGGGNYRVDAPAHTYAEEGTYTST